MRFLHLLLLLGAAAPILALPTFNSGDNLNTQQSQIDLAKADAELAEARRAYSSQLGVEAGYSAGKRIRRALSAQTELRLRVAKDKAVSGAARLKALQPLLKKAEDQFARPTAYLPQALPGKDNAAELQKFKNGAAAKLRIYRAILKDICADNEGLEGCP